MRHEVARHAIVRAIEQNLHKLVGVGLRMKPLPAAKMHGDAVRAMAEIPSADSAWRQTNPNGVRHEQHGHNTTAPFCARFGRRLAREASKRDKPPGTQGVQCASGGATMTVTVNSPRFDPYKNYKFRIKCDGRYVAGFSEASALGGFNSAVEHRTAVPS